MLEARKLVEVIDQLEKQSEELNSAIDLYEEINSLYVKISDTSEKYEKLFEDIDKAKLSLKKANENIKNTLESTNNEEVLEKINCNINDSYKETMDTLENIKKYLDHIITNFNRFDDYMMESNANDIRTSDNVQLLKLESKGINSNVIELKKIVLGLKDILESNKIEYYNKLDKSIKNLEENILLNQENKKNELVGIIENSLKVVDDKYKKSIKNIYIGLSIVVVISIANILIK